jgi:queuine tRNA-ribosyltransferase/7-cyano-7-deazaguanine tRNA-ribosyltransferase
MIEFKILKQSKKSRARLGVLCTPHGEVQTPALVPVATLAAVKALRSDEIAATKTQLLISNTYHLHLQSGEKVVAAAGGINKFMHWPRPTMTDSGGFQVFSLGFGRDLGVGKVRKTAKPKTRVGSGTYYPTKLERAIEHGAQPNAVKITEDGAHFRSPLNGRELFLGPRESMTIQGKLGADIIFAFDECTPPGVSRTYMEASLVRTHRWAKQCIAFKKSDQALYGIVQGSYFEDLRKESARAIAALGDGFAGYGIGGDIGEYKLGPSTVLDWVVPLLDQRKPRHLLGIGDIDDMERIIKGGADTFDCTIPTHYARRGVAFTARGKINFNKEAFLRDKGAVDRTCGCLVCVQYSRSYIAHLVRANEITGGALLTFHNLYFFNTYAEQLRERIKKGEL